MDLIFSDCFRRNEPGVFSEIPDVPLTCSDCMPLADVTSCVEAGQPTTELYADRGMGADGNRRDADLKHGGLRSVCEGDAHEQHYLVWARSLALCHRAEGISIRKISISLFAGLALLFASGARVNGQQPSATPGSVKHELGFENIKHNANGDLTVQGDKLQFKAGRGKAEVSIPSVQDVFTEQDFKETMGGTAGTLAKMAVPFGGGRILSLFREKVDMLTVEYRDRNGGLHGAIFTLPQWQAQLLKRQLVAAGAYASIPPEEPAKPEEKKQ